MNKNADQCISIQPGVWPCQAGNGGSGVLKNLLPGCAGRNLEVHATVVVDLAGGGEIEVGEQDLVGPVCGKVKGCIAHDRVVEDLGPVTVFENKHGRRLGGHGPFCMVDSV